MSTPNLPSLHHLRSGFLWGVSTSSYQIEGATREDGRGPSIWDTYGAKGLIANGDTGDIACDHYHRYRDDVALMQQLGVKAYRFSVAWPRVQPHGEGAANAAGLGFYDRLIDALLGAGIAPWLCLYHWDLPQTLEGRGGWTNRDIVARFADYTHLVVRRLGDRVKRFATFNEPSVFTLFGYGLGHGRPDTKDVDTVHRAIHHVNLAHGAAVDVVRAMVPGATVGAVHNDQPCIPCSPADAQAAETFHAYWNLAFADPQCLGAYPPLLQQAIEPFMREGDLARIRRPLDWFGLNHYGPIYAKADPEARFGIGYGAKPATIPLTPIGWPIHPQAFGDTLLRLHRRYGLPIYVLENGLGGYDTPDADGVVADPQRIDYLRAYISAMDAAAAQGADVRGYFVWSLLDNFEWEQGYRVRFGLTYVDYPSQRRIPKSSFHWYAGVIEAKGKMSGA